MKSVNKTVSYILKFFTSVLLTSAAYISVKYYIEFVELTAGSYNIAMILGQPLRDFLITLLLLVAGVLAFLTFVFKSCKRKESTIYPYYLIGMGVLWVILPSISVYNISRFTGTLIYQTVSGIAIIANVVFMMISVCCGLIAAIDIIRSLFSVSERENTGDFSAVILTGIPTGCAFSALMTAVLKSVVGLSGIFIILGVLTAAVGVLSAIMMKKGK
ncbi:MAG: hypothetical protein ACI4RU_06620 [Acutalibacteraceae bacterium]